MTEGNILKISIKLLENIIKEAYETTEETKLHLKNKKKIWEVNKAARILSSFPNTRAAASC